MSEENIVLIASTPLHLFDAIIIAQSFPQNRYHLLYIDQISLEDVYFAALQIWKNTPFISTHIVMTKKKSLLEKIQSKKTSIREILAFIDMIKPQRIIVGNDRKNETAAVIQKVKHTIAIDYMDDGLHSYIIEQSHIFKYTFVDSCLKSIVYMHKIITPKIIGGSKYIENLYLYQPALRHVALKDKPAYRLDTSYLHKPNIQEWISIVIQKLHIDLDQELSDISSILFLPHPKELSKEKLLLLQKKLLHKEHIAIKLHPRDNTSKIYFQSHRIIHQRLSAEIIFLSDHTIKIYGFSSTALLMAKWLHPTLSVSSLQFNTGKFTELEQLMQHNGIEVLSINTIEF